MCGAGHGIFVNPGGRRGALRDLGLDAGYLSRILAGFEKRGQLLKQPSDSDGRLSHLVLTDAGRAAFAPMNAATRAGIGQMLRGIAATDQDRLVAAMQTIEGWMEGGAAATGLALANLAATLAVCLITGFLGLALGKWLTGR